MKRSPLPVLSPFSHSFSKTCRRVKPAGDRANLLQFFQVLVPIVNTKHFNRIFLEYVTVSYTRKHLWLNHRRSSCHSRFAH